MAKDMLTFDAGSLTDDQLMTVMAVANITKARMDAVEKGCKAVLVDRMETGHRTATLDGEPLADIQRTAGGDEGTWVVRDREAYGAWLARQEGMEDFVRQAPMPTDDAMDPGFLKPLVEKIGGGDVPDGVEWKAPAAPQVRVGFKDKARALEALERRPATVERLLGGTSSVPAAKPAPAPEADDAAVDDLFAGLGL